VPISRMADLIGKISSVLFGILDQSSLIINRGV
jgi:hypothetical protein